MKVAELERLATIYYSMDPCEEKDDLGGFIEDGLDDGDLGIPFHTGLKDEVRRIMQEGE